MLQNGDVIAAECDTNGTRLHRFSAATYVDPATGQTLHQETITPTAGGCGITLGLVGFIYSNMNDGKNGVAKINPANGASTTMGLPGNALGIATDPVNGHLVYADQGCKPGFVKPAPPTCKILDLDPATNTTTTVISFPVAQIGYVDGITFDPTGTYLFLTNRYPTFDLVVISRGARPGPGPGPGPSSATLVQLIPETSEGVGIAFHAASPKFVVTNNQDGTMTRFDFRGDDYTQPPSQSVFASGGFRGDLMQVGPDTCLYLTQDGVRVRQRRPEQHVQQHRTDLRRLRHAAGRDAEHAAAVHVLRLARQRREQQRH